MKFTNKMRKYRKYDIGDYTYGSPEIFVWDEKPTPKLKIGKFCMIAPEVKIFLGGNHPTDVIAMYPVQAFIDGWRHIKNHCISKGNVEIGNDVWIGYDAVIMSGVKIGDGAVIGARSVVTKDVPSYAVVAGNPARFKKFRDVRRHNWWDLDINQIKENITELKLN